VRPLLTARRLRHSQSTLTAAEARETHCAGFAHRPLFKLGGPSLRDGMGTDLCLCDARRGALPLPQQWQRCREAVQVRL